MEDVRDHLEILNPNLSLIKNFLLSYFDEKRYEVKESKNRNLLRSVIYGIK